MNGRADSSRCLVWVYLLRYKGIVVSHYTFTVHQDTAREATVYSGGIFGAYTTLMSAYIYSSWALNAASPTF